MSVFAIQRIFSIFPQGGGGGQEAGEFPSESPLSSCAFARSTGKLVCMMCVNCRTKIA